MLSSATVWNAKSITLFGNVYSNFTNKENLRDPRFSSFVFVKSKRNSIVRINLLYRKIYNFL